MQRQRVETERKAGMRTEGKGETQWRVRLRLFGNDVVMRPSKGGKSAWRKDETKQWYRCRKAERAAGAARIERLPKAIRGGKAGARGMWQCPSP